MTDRAGGEWVRVKHGPHRRHRVRNLPYHFHSLCTSYLQYMKMHKKIPGPKQSFLICLGKTLKRYLFVIKITFFYTNHINWFFGYQLYFVHCPIKYNCHRTLRQCIIWNCQTSCWKMSDCTAGGQDIIKCNLTMSDGWRQSESLHTSTPWTSLAPCQAKNALKNSNSNL